MKKEREHPKGPPLALPPEQEFWNAVQQTNDILAPLFTQAAQYLSMFPKLKRLVQRRDWARDRLGSRKLGKRARLLFDVRNAKVNEFYDEFRSFTRKVVRAFRALQQVLPAPEIASLEAEVNPSDIRSTCRVVQRVAERLNQLRLDRQPPDSRETRLLKFKQERKTTITAVRDAASVHKPDFQKWRKNRLPGDSVMSQRIEDVLSGETPLKRRQRRTRRTGSSLPE